MFAKDVEQNIKGRVINLFKANCYLQLVYLMKKFGGDALVKDLVKVVNCGW